MALKTDILSKYRNLLMGFAALWIFFLHEWITVLNVPVLSSVEGFLKFSGYCGVDIFFFLSGMGLCYAIKKGSLKDYYIKRIVRVMIPYAVVSALFGVIDGRSAVDILAIISGYKFWFVNIYACLWFVPGVMSLYIVFPLYWKFFSRSERKLLFLCAVLLVWLAVSVLGAGVIREDLYGFTNRIPVFLTGVYFGTLVQGKNPKLPKFVWPLIVCGVLGGFLLQKLTSFHGLYLIVPVSNCCIPNWLLSVSLCFFLAGLFELISRYKGLSRLVSGVFGFFGSISLELYCVQEWLGEKLLPGLSARLGAMGANAVFLGIAVLCALLLSRLCGLISSALQKKPCNS